VHAGWPKAVLSVFLIAIMCSPFLVIPSQAAAASPSPTVLSLGGIATPPLASLNPLNPSSNVAIIYEYLFSMNWPPTSYITPLLAHGYSENAAGTQYVINLRSNLKWSDGSPLNASDLAFTLNYDNNTLQEFYPAMTSLTILNSTAVQFNLASPDINFIAGDIIGNGVLVAPKEVFGNMPAANISSYQNFNNIVGDGPYVISSYTGQNPVIYHANPYYWNGAPKIPTLQIYAYTSNTAYFDAFVSGQIDGAGYFGDYNGLQSIATVPDTTVLGPPQATPGCTAGAYLNAWQYPTNITSFRQALAWATNVTQINDELNGAFASSALANEDWLIPAYNQQIGFNSTGPQGYSYNIATAKQLLQNAGFKYSGSTLEYPNGTAVSLTIKFRPNYEPYSQDISTLLVTQWGQLGIKVNLDPLADQVLRAMANDPTGWQVIVTSVLGPQTNLGVTPGPTVQADLGNDYVNVNGTQVPWNTTYYSTITRLETEQPGTAAFNTDAQTAAKMLVQGVPSIPMFNIDNWGVVHNDFNWGSPSNQTGIYQTQAITQFQFWPLTLDEIAPLSSSSTTTTTTTTTTTPPTTTTTTTTPPTTTTTTTTTPPTTTTTTTTTPPTTTTTTTTTTSSSSSSTIALAPSVLGVIGVAAAVVVTAMIFGGARRGRPWPRARL
jgi:peptide/nickel transport system substrate-binding protein